MNKPGIPFLSVIKWPLASCIILLAISCLPRKVSLSEQPLFPETGVEKIWLFDQIADWSNGNVPTFHHCTMLVQSPNENGGAAQFIQSTYSASDSSFTFNILRDPSPVWGRNDRWPFYCHIDSGQGRLNWRWDRRSVWMEGAGMGPTSTPFKIEGKQFQIPPATPFRVLESPLVWALESPNNSQTKLRKSIDNLVVFREAQSMMFSKDTRALYWLNLADSNGNLQYFLIKLNALNQLEPLAMWYYSQTNGWSNLLALSKCEVHPNTVWRSAVSGKSYSLFLGIDSALGHILIRPRKLDQEIQALQRSFWMGAVEVESENGEVKSYGNMYIFQP